MTKLDVVIRQDADELFKDISNVLTQLEGSTIVVTGAFGFLFSYMLDILALWNEENKYPIKKIIAIDNFKIGNKERLAYLSERKDFEFICHDISTPIQLEDEIDWIIHGAGIASPMFYRKFPLETIDVNVMGTRHMLNLAREKSVKGVAIMSTSEVYGDPIASMIPTPESYRGNVSCYGPRACYDESKRLSESLAYIYHDLYKLPVKIIRPFNIFGPGQSLADKRIMPDLLNSVVESKSIVLFSDGKPTRSFCYVKDAIAGLLSILVNDQTIGKPINLGCDEQEISILDLASLMQKIAKEDFEIDLNVEHKVSNDAAYLTDNPQRRCPDIDFLRELIGEYQYTGLRDGVVRTLNHYFNQKVLHEEPA
jgi:UDP-glucuronate decarboxylase